MRFGGRAAAAIEVLEAIERQHRPASEALKDWGVSHRFAGSGDRAAIGNIVYDALRWLTSSAWLAGDDSPRAIVLAMLARRWNLDLAVAFANDVHAPVPPGAAEMERLRTADLATASDHVRADVPEWVFPRFVRLFGDDAIAEGEALALRPPLDMRTNRLKGSRERVVKALARFHATPARYAPDGIHIAPTAGEGRHPNVQVEPAFQKGWFEVQDEGSQLAALAVAAKAGQQVLDLCAGAGGKTLALAACMGGKGRVVATDEDRGRLAPIFDRVKRAAAHNVEVRAAGSDLGDLAGRMDAVLIDAPCTGTGIWRRRPDAKWKLTEQALATRGEEQAALLAAAMPFVKVGGRLVYVTCSLLPEENEERIATFLGEAGDFRAVSPTDVIAGMGAEPGLAEAALCVSNGVVLTPRRTETDGFFVSVMERTR